MLLRENKTYSSSSSNKSSMYMLILLNKALSRKKIADTNIIDIIFRINFNACPLVPF